MITLFIIVLSIIVGAGIIIRNRADIFPIDEADSLSKLWLGIVVAVLGVVTAIIQPFAVERVDASGVGFKVHLSGDARGVSPYQYKTGWVVYNTWTDQFKEIATNQQHIEYDNITVITKGGFQAQIKPSFNYSVVGANAADMYVNLRKELSEIEQGWLKNAIYSSVNDVANKWSVDSIFNWREQFESSIIVECNKRVSKWFTVSQLRSNIVPPPSLQAAIEAKTKAVQDVQVAENRKNVAIAEALTAVAAAEGKANAKIAQARGDSAEAVITANGEAQAIKIKQMQLSPLYIEYIRASTWDGKYPETWLGSGSQTLFNLK